jgi:cytochrome c
MVPFIKPGRIQLYLLIAVVSTIVLNACSSNTPRVLVFTKTKGFHHESIPAGIAAVQKLGKDHGFSVDTTTDATYFKESTLKKYKAVIFLNTTGNVLNGDEQVQLERYIQAGGGFLGVHAAADTEYDWPWYNKLVGAWFLSHPGNPNVRKATVILTDTAYQRMAGLPEHWERTDEWYNYKNINPDIKVLATLDENTYEGGTNGDHHPIAWYHDFDGGRSAYIGGGHTNESYSEPLYLQHLLAGIKYAMGTDNVLDYSKAYAVKTPEENRFTKVLLSDDLNEPMELGVAPDGRVFFVERRGTFFKYDPVTKATTLLHTFPVLPDDKIGFGNGMLGMTLDPDFSKNNYIYFFYTPNKTPATQYVSRFTLGKNDSLDLKSEKVILQIPLELEVSAHTGGSMAWDKNKNLFISTGDNTVPFASEGYAPIDEIPGRITFDAQRSAGNTNDLRGKVLRIHPEADGSYTIPEGNLFAKGTAGTRPEIYTMGCRNPYRISVDPATSILYWGEVGPDAGEDGKQGPRGYDEINQAKKAGNYGWPYFVGDSKPYHAYNFATKEIGALFNPEAPVNNSPLNTGLKTLPPTQKAMIWYPYANSTEFPELANGGRCAMAGPVYHYNEGLASNIKFPAYYDKALFIYDWMRNWVFAVRLDENNNYKRMEPFMALTGNFKRPIDLETGPDGAMYMLEYGSVYGVDNVDARLVRIEYNGGNRAPLAKITTNDTIGLAPYKVNFSSKDSYDPDEDDVLQYEWTFNDAKAVSKEANPVFTFEKNGVYKVTLKVTDPSGESSVDTKEIKVGNTLPQVSITTPDNSTFFFGRTPLKYAVSVKDAEDTVIAKENIMITLTYLEKVGKQAALIGHQQVAPVNMGKAIMESSDCKACHTLDKVSVGPAFIEVAKRYHNNSNAVALLSEKIIKGGGGVWGEHSMAAHPQISLADAGEIVKYILSLASEKSTVSLPQEGTLDLKEHLTKGAQGRYVFTASYTDKGGAITPLTGTDILVLRPARVKAVEVDEVRNIAWNNDYLGSIHHKSYFVLKNVDLKGIKQLTYRYASNQIGATIEVLIKSPKGDLISTVNYATTGDWNKFTEVSTPIKDPGGKNDLYFVFKKEQGPNQHMCSVDWIEFKR